MHHVCSLACLYVGSYVIKSCMIWGLYSGVTEDLNLLGCGAVSLCK